METQDIMVATGFSELVNQLTPHNGQINLPLGKLTDNFDAFLKNVYFKEGSVIAIDQVSIETNEQLQLVTITGVSSFMNVPSMPLTASFAVDAEGEIRAVLKYMLIDASKTSGFWKFSDSFKTLPAFGDASAASGSLLDDLKFKEASFVVASHAGYDTSLGLDLDAGINFGGIMKPPAQLGILKNSLGETDALTVSGFINVPSDEKYMYNPALERNVASRRGFPWLTGNKLPGIHLHVDLGIDMTMGGVKLTNSIYQIYTPLKLGWQNLDKSYQPIAAYTATLDLPKADITLDIVGEISDETIAVEALCEGVSVGNLADLADISGGDNSLSDTLPDIMTKPLNALKKLELTNLGFSFSYGNSGFSIGYLAVQVAMENLNWQIWDDHIVVNELGCRFAINNPFNNPQFETGFWGKTEIEGVEIDLEANSRDAYLISMRLGEAQTLPIRSLMKKFAPEIPALPNMVVNDLVLMVSIGNFISFSGGLMEKPDSWSLDLGPQNLTFSNIRFDLKIPKAGKIGGSFRGEVGIGKNIRLKGFYAIPGDFKIKAECDELNFKELVGKLSKEKLSLPSGFDMTFYNSSVLLKKDSGGMAFQMGTRYEDDAYFALEIKKVEGKWGVAGGLSLLDAQPSKLPGMSFLEPFEKVVDLQDFTLVLASYSDAAFKFPGMEQFANPALTSSNIPMPAQAGGLVAGLNVYAKWKIDTKKKEMKLLKQVLGLDPELGVTLQVGKNPSKDTRLFVSYTTELMSKHPFQAKFGFAMNNGTPELFLAGMLQMKIQGEMCQFDVAMSLVKGGFFFSGSMKGTLQFGDLQLSNLALALGFNWGGIPSLGIAGTINLPDFTSSIAVLFDSTDPSKSLLAGAISDLSLGDIAETIAQTDIPDDIEGILDGIEVKGNRPFDIPLTEADNFDDQDLTAISAAFQSYGTVSVPSTETSALFVVNKPGKSWSLTDMPNNMRHYQIEKVGKNLRVSLNPQIYLAPAGAQMGTLVFPQGYFMSGTLSVLGLEWSTQIDIRTNKGVAAQSYLNKPLVIYNKNFFELSDVEGKSGPFFSVSTFFQNELKNPELRPPHLYFSGRLFLLGLESESFVKATKNGFAFALSRTVDIKIPGKAFSGKVFMESLINGHFESVKNFGAGGEFTLKFEGKIDLAKLGFLGDVVDDMGKIKIDLNVDADLELGYDGKKAFVNFSGGFKLQDIKHNFKLELKATNADMKKAGEWVFDEIKQIVTDLFDTAEEWMNAIGDGFVEVGKGAEQVAKVLGKGYKKSVEEAAELMHEAGENFEEMGRAFKKVYGTTAKTFAPIMKDLGAGANEIAKDLKNAFKTGTKDVAKILDEVGESPEAVAGALKSAYKQSAKQAAQTLKSIGKDATTIAKGLKSAYKQSAKQVAQTLDSVGVDAGAVGKALRYAYKQSAKDVAKTMKDIGKGGEAIGKALQTGFRYSGKTAANMMKSIGVSSSEIGKALKNTFKMSTKDFTNTFKSIGKGANDIGNALKNTYKQSAEQTLRLLNGAGISNHDMSNMLKGVYKLSAENTAKTFKKIGKSANEIANVMKSSYKQSAKDMAKVLDKVGVGVDEVGGALKNVYGQSAEQAAGTLKDIGKSAKDVGKVLKNAYKLSTKDTSKYLKKSFKLGKSGLKDALKGAGYASKEVDKVVKKLWKSLKFW
ncbi:phage tail tape measure protein [Microscilla marina]|nr:hypothetical protein [Microscilla marina]